EGPARLVIDPEGLGLAAGAVEGEHQLSLQALSQRPLPDEGLELAHELVTSAELELGVDPLFDRPQPEVLEPASLLLGGVLECEVGQRRAAPHGNPLAKATG